MDLETWRKREKLTYAELAELYQAGDQNSARRHSLGLSWPSPEQIERIREISGGAVRLEDMHARRLDRWRERRGQQVAAE
jgi:hypothetical protein